MLLLLLLLLQRAGGGLWVVACLCSCRALRVPAAAAGCCRARDSTPRCHAPIPLAHVAASRSRPRPPIRTACSCSTAGC